MYDLKQTAINVMLGIHLGDALGVPFEMMTRQEILNATGGEGVTRPRFDFDPAARKIPDARGLAAGATSDDTQLAEATAEGFIMSRRYVHELHVLLHLEALWRDAAGWGGTTKRSLYELDKWYRERRRGFGIHPPPSFRTEKDEKLWAAVEPRHPAHPARPRAQARGNGVAMKIAPFGIRAGVLGGGDFESGEALEEIMAFARMTHADPVCGIAAYAVAGIISDSIADDPDVAAERVMGRVKAAEAIHVLAHRGTDRFSDALGRALALASAPEALWDFGAAGRADALTTVALAIAIWSRHLADAGPQPAVLEAINAGGDTDTVASMVGAMMGASSESKAWWPSDWIASLKDGGIVAVRTGGRLADVCALRRAPEGYDLDTLKRRLGY